MGPVVPFIRLSAPWYPYLAANPLSGTPYPAVTSLAPFNWPPPPWAVPFIRLSPPWYPLSGRHPPGRYPLSGCHPPGTLYPAATPLGVTLYPADTPWNPLSGSHPGVVPLIGPKGGGRGGFPGPLPSRPISSPQTPLHLPHPSLDRDSTAPQQPYRYVVVRKIGAVAHNLTWRLGM